MIEYILRLRRELKSKDIVPKYCIINHTHEQLILHELNLPYDSVLHGTNLFDLNIRVFKWINDAMILPEL